MQASTKSGKGKKSKKTIWQPVEDPEMVGAIKIKDGLFIGDELAAQVSLLTTGPRVCGR